MIKQLVHKVLLKRHFWRNATFGELVELYTSNMLRAMAGNLFSIFIPIYLLASGYSVFNICFYFVFYFVARTFADFLAGHAIARFGPKHGLLISHVSNIINLFCLLFIHVNPVLFWVSAVFNAAGTSFQFLSLYVDFSKVKHVEHNGKEQGFFYMLEKIGASLGPIVGGFIAAHYGATYTIVASIFIYGLSLVPLMLSPEPVRTKQHLKFKGLPLKKLWRDSVAHSARYVDMTISANAWTLYIVLVVFKGNGYEGVGAINSLSIVLAIGATYIFGKLIDRRHSLLFYRVAVIGDVVFDCLRAFAKTIGLVAFINFGNEVTMTGVTMAFNKGMYAAADDLPGYRIAYFTALEMISELVKGTCWLILAILVQHYGDITGLQTMFVLAGLILLLALVERFKALRPGRLETLLQ